MWEQLGEAAIGQLFARPDLIEQGRMMSPTVRILDLLEAFLSAVVSDPSKKREYVVTAKLLPGSRIQMDCDCPQARRGNPCAHMVAALLAAHRARTAPAQVAPEEVPEEKADWRELFQHMPQSKRRSQLADQILVLQLVAPTSSPYYYSRLWKIRPLTIPAHAVVETLGPEPQALRDPQALREALLRLPSSVWESALSSPPTTLRATDFLNVGPEVVTLKALLRGQDTGYHYYSSDAQNYRLHSLFLWAATNPSVPLVWIPPQQSRTPHVLTVVERILYPRIRIRPLEDGALEVGADLAGLDEDLMASVDFSRSEQIMADPRWVLFDGKLLAQVMDLDLLVELRAWGETLPTVVLPEERDEFLKLLTPLLVSHPAYVPDIYISDELVPAEKMAPRLYLSEVDGALQAELRFVYNDEHEVSYASHYPTVSPIWQDDQGLTLAWLERRPEEEEARMRALSNFGLKRGSSPGLFVLRKRVDAADFLLKHLPRLVQEGYEIYGEENIRSVRVNRHRPTLSARVSSGIDWFDVQMVVRFGDVEASIRELRRALRKKQRYVKLADGSIGEIPEEWVQRLRLLFGIAETGKGEEENLRLDPLQATLLDQLVQEVDGNLEADRVFRERLERLQGVERIEPRPLPQGFRGELRPYQVAGYNWLHFLHEYELGGCLADDMGLGKTVQVLAFLQSLREQGHADRPDLIVVPKSLLANWEREASRFTPDLKVRIHAGTDRARDLSAFDAYDLVITTYGLVLRDLKLLKDYRFHYVILDESQAVKNPVAKTSRAVRLLQSDHRLALTGTPVENNLLELWSLFAFLNPGMLGSLEFFSQEFAKPVENRQDEAAATRLRRMVHPFILRRTKEQVAPELPPRTERILYTDMEPAQAKLYNRWRDYYRGVVLGLLEEEQGRNVHMKVLEGLLRLRQIAIHPILVDEKFRGHSAKFDLLLETLDTLREEGHKALIFSQFVQVLKILRTHLDKAGIPYAYLDGRTRKRQEVVDRFQEDPALPFFLISLKAGGVGLNLTAADYVIHIDPWWNPAVERQATDRTHRIGQDKPVFVYKLITRGTVEEKILQLQERKQNLVDQVISTESTFFKQLSPEDIALLFSA